MLRYTVFVQVVCLCVLESRQFGDPVGEYRLRFCVLGITASGLLRFPPRFSSSGVENKECTQSCGSGAKIGPGSSDGNLFIFANRDINFYSLINTGVASLCDSSDHSQFSSSQCLILRCCHLNNQLFVAPPPSSWLVHLIAWVEKNNQIQHVCVSPLAMPVTTKCRILDLLPYHTVQWYSRNSMRRCPHYSSCPDLVAFHPVVRGWLSLSVPPPSPYTSPELTQGQHPPCKRRV